MSPSTYSATPQIVVLGAGPAGAAVAIGLRRLGYNVICVSRPRRPKCIEGISERVYSAFKGLGLDQALACVSAPVPRQVCWNGKVSKANTERLIERDRFDNALLRDLQTQAVEIQLGTVDNVSRHAQGWHIQLQSGAVLHADFLVEARGRRAPHVCGEVRRGPESVALSQFWQLTGPADSSMGVHVVGLDDGWMWLVKLSDGRLFTQFSLAAKRHALPERSEAAEWSLEVLADTPAAAALLGAAKPLTQAYFRGCTSLLNAGVVGGSYLRIGDAAMAVDPLSGNGIFQSLSSALVAPAVINTLIKRPSAADLAQQFYQDRLHHLFMRFARLGRDFYRQSVGRPDSDYWYDRQAWPDDEAAHAATDRVLGVAQRPVLNGGFIEPAEVVITDNNPLGIWTLDGASAVERYRQWRRTEQKIDRG